MMLPLQYPADLQQLPDLVCGLCTLAYPLPRLLGVDLDVGGLRARVVGPDAVYKATVAWAARICDDYPVEGGAFGAVPSEPDLNRHLQTFLSAFYLVLNGIRGILGTPPLPICFIIFCISPNCLMSF